MEDADERKKHKDVFNSVKRYPVYEHVLFVFTFLAMKVIRIVIQFHVILPSFNQIRIKTVCV